MDYLSHLCGKTVYLIGPMTGRDNFNFAAFDYYAGRLRGMGIHVINPAEIPLFDDEREPYSYDDYMRVGCFHATVADAIVTLPDWMESNGAVKEGMVALKYGNQCLYEIAEQG